MCGIVGWVSAGKKIDPMMIAKANNMVRYRGPDDFGYITFNKELEVQEWNDEWMRDYNKGRGDTRGSFGFRRLSIIDLSSKGHQPMHEGNYKYWIVFNGEIYNYIELQQELIRKGHRFRSRTDTEVVLKSYIEWSENCLVKFNGMWSFCILDTRGKKLFCARDRLGIKPFYYYFDGKHFIFGSEVKQILSLLPSKAEMNPTVLFDYLALGSYGNETRETFFKSIYKMLPGEYIEINMVERQKLNMKKNVWWDLPFPSGPVFVNESEIYENIRNLLEDSIRLRLRSDVPVGTCLSGGLDSSGIVSLVDRFNKKTNNYQKHKVFVIGSINPEIDETQYAKIMIKNTNVKPYFKFPKPVDLERELESFIWHHDEPLITASMFGGWHAYKLAQHSGVKVVLDGQGSDELLGGYYNGAHIDYLTELLFSKKISCFFKQLNANSLLHKTSRSIILLEMAQDIAKYCAHSVLPSHFRPVIYRKTNGWLNKDFVKANIRNSHFLNKDYYNTRCAFSSKIKQNVYELTRFTNLPGILRQVDRNSMASSVEARVPFLDYRLVEFLYVLPVRYILRNGYTKYCYREAMRGIIPATIRLRTDKRGFTMPDRDLLDGALPFVLNIIESVPHSSSIYDIKKIKKRIMASIRSKNLYSPIVWRIINTIIWQLKFNINE